MNPKPAGDLIAALIAIALLPLLATAALAGEADAPAGEAVPAAKKAAVVEPLEFTTNLVGTVLAAGDPLIPGGAPGGGGVVQAQADERGQYLNIQLPDDYLALEGAPADDPKLPHAGSLIRDAHLLLVVHGGEVDKEGREIRVVAVNQAKQAKDVSKLFVQTSAWHRFAIRVPAMVDGSPVAGLLLNAGGSKPFFVAAGAVHPERAPAPGELAAAANPLLACAYSGTRSLGELVGAWVGVQPAEVDFTKARLLYPGKPGDDRTAAQSLLSAVAKGWAQGGSRAGAPAQPIPAVEDKAIQFYPPAGLAAAIEALGKAKLPLVFIHLTADKAPALSVSTLANVYPSLIKQGCWPVLMIAPRGDAKLAKEWDGWLAKARQSLPGATLIDLGAVAMWNAPAEANAAIPPASEDALLSSLTVGVADLRARLDTLRSAKGGKKE